MGVIVEGFEPDVAQDIKEKMQRAISKGMKEVAFWSTLMSLKAEVSLEGNNIYIRRETI